MAIKPAQKGKRKHKIKEVTLTKVMGVIKENDEGKLRVYCPDCGQEPIISTVDYDLTSDNKLMWYSYKCPRCNNAVIHFSKSIGGGLVDVGDEYDINGRHKNHKRETVKKEVKKTKKVLPKKVANHKKKIPKLA